MILHKTRAFCQTRKSSILCISLISYKQLIPFYTILHHPTPFYTILHPPTPFYPTATQLLPHSTQLLPNCYPILHNANGVSGPYSNNKSNILCPSPKQGSKSKPLQSVVVISLCSWFFAPGSRFAIKRTITSCNPSFRSTKNLVSFS